MSIFDFKAIWLEIGIKENITDSRCLEFMKDWDFTEEEADKFRPAILGSCHSPMAEKIITFICEYKDGVLHADKYGIFEPLKYVFDISDKRRFIDIIAYPGGTLYLLKRRRFDITIDNRFWSLLPGKPLGELPEYLCYPLAELNFKIIYE